MLSGVIVLELGDDILLLDGLVGPLVAEDLGLLVLVSFAGLC